MDPDAIVLAGGDNRRLDGVDKVMLEVGGRAILLRILDGLADLGVADPIVVGPPRALPGPVRWCREVPPGGGPVVALAAARPLLHRPVTLVLAGDLPFVTAAVPDLLAALDDGRSDGAVLIDGTGRRNLLAAAWRTAALTAALDRAPARGGAVRDLLAGRTIVEVADPAGLGADCDTWGAVEAARARAERPA